MRKTEKQITLEFIKTLYQAEEEICRQAKINNIQRVQELLAECQEGAIQLGNTIESLEGQEHVTISYIEQYCDILYHIFESIQQNTNITPGKIRKLLNKHILRIENSIRYDIAEQLEIVFLPYKFSMWDSLESIWKAADADAQCKAYVIPIPYYDRASDGTFQKMHYEGHDFPDYIPVTWYEDYDFEKRKPDAIFIHNPYDENNYVTSVHPFFYTTSLRKFTDKLVYIPYYISSEINPDYHGGMEGRVCRILSNGVLNSDFVIVQSENTKQLYINVLEKNFPDISRKHWDSKIWGLGSPKLDRVRNMQRDEHKLPKHWKEIIYNKDGSRKKTIFYNISLDTLLKNSDIIDKIEDVLNFFKTNDDLALWWRPHPLYESTLASMRPDILERYLKIKEKYKQEGWGILDEGFDLEQAIALTDAYYGDNSSVVQLYKETQKPIMIQKVSVRAAAPIKAEEIPIWSSAFFVDDDDIWFIHGKLNALMRYSICKNYTYYIDSVPNEPMFRESLYKGIYKWKNRLFIIPCWAREIAVYNIQDNEFQKIPVKNVERYEDKILFYKIFAYERYLYCIPYQYNAIVKIDMESCKLEYFNINLIAPINDATQVGNVVIALFTHTNIILSFNLESNEIHIMNIGITERKYTNLSNIGNTLYLFDKQTNSLVKIYGGNYKCEQIMYPSIFNETFEGTRMSSIYPDLILLDTPTSNEIKIINDNCQVVFEEKSENSIAYTELYCTYRCGIESNNRVDFKDSYYYNTSENSIYKFSCGNLAQKFFPQLSTKEFSKINMRFSDERKMISYENQIDNLTLWTGNLKEHYSKGNHTHQDCGLKILLNLKKLLI